MFVAWPASASHLSGGLISWSWRGTARVTAVLKAAYRFSDDVLVPHQPPRFAPLDRYHGDDAATHVVMSGDAVPRREHVDVTALGHAEAIATSAVRLAVLWEGDPLIDRTLHIQRAAGGLLGPSEPVPLTYEFALGGPGNSDNPIGTTTASVLDAREAARPASFGPIAATWPCRSQHVGGMPPPPGWSMDLPDPFDWQYFQAAPPDQQVTRLEGDETVVLEGFAASPKSTGNRPRRIALPGLRPHGVLFADDTALPLDWRADSLHIDVDSEVMTLSWRAERQLVDRASLDSHLLVGGVATHGLGFELPARRPPR